MAHKNKSARIIFLEIKKSEESDLKFLREDEMFWMMKWSENELYLQMKITVHDRWRKGKFLKNFLCDRWG